MATSTFFQLDLSYSDGQKTGVMVIALSGLTSLTAIVSLFVFKRPQRRTFQNTQMFGYFMSLLFSNILQAIGSVVDFEWVARGGVSSNGLCSLQGGIKQAGNLGTSIWSLIIGVHLYHILFLRIRATKGVFVGALISAWSLILVLILVGRFAIQQPDKGPYFGIAGSSCWIGSNYGVEQMVMDYLFSFISIGLGFILYALVLLRIRGYLVRDRYHKWRLNFGGKENEWKLSITQDTMSTSSMNRVAQKLVWYPVSYTLILIPITVVRLVEFNGTTVPFWIVTTAAVIFNLMGFVNVILLVFIENSSPESRILPSFSTERDDSHNSLDKRGSMLSFAAGDSGLQEKYVQNTSQRVIVNLPTKPQNTFVAPDEWKTTAPRGVAY